MLSAMLRRLGLLELDDRIEHPAVTTAAMLILSFLGACLTGLLAQIRLPIPGTPVPVTGQVMAVLVCGALLGSGYGAFSQILYVGLGILGMPWFTGGDSGYLVLAGPTGGYLIGFVVAALFVGTTSERGKAAKSVGGQTRRMLAAVCLIYFFGVVHLIVTMQIGVATAFAWGVLPFIAGDVVKAIMAAFFTSAVLPKDR